MSNPVKVDEPVKDPIKEPKQEPTKEPTDPVKEDKEPKEPKEPATDYSKEVENLRAEIVTLTEKAGQVETVSKENETLKKDIEGRDLKITQYEELITKLVETKLKQIPEEYKDLIPDNLELTQKLNWLEKAEAKGLFNKEERKKPNLEIGKPMNIEPENVDTSKLTGTQLLKLAYNTIKNK